MLTGYQLAWLPAAHGHDVAVGFLGRDSAEGTGMALPGACWSVTSPLRAEPLSTEPVSVSSAEEPEG